MAAIKMVEEAEATGTVKYIYDEIKDTFEIDFVPNMYKLMAPNPAYLGGELEQGQGGDDRVGQPRPPDQGDRRGRRIRGKRLRLLTAGLPLRGCRSWV